MNCEKCGQPLHPGTVFCEKCGHTNPLSSAEAAPAASQPQAELQKPENFAMGFLGALGGALLGAASIVLFGQLGYISALSGLILAFCTVQGYKLLGKQQSTKGIIVSLILIAITPYFADRLSLALTFQRVSFPDVPLTNVFAAIPELVASDPDFAADYWKNLLMTYGFAALGAFGIIKSLFSKKK